ncbi:hypothetical protein EB796_010109 [Bugula neritina]|uniref:Uncharacterized protein n=1 Tax=Bugula neritina TaxID=10212 RepID=A0A7J7K0U3_BUGNE|nr:hypothetical protein EB796_010109 [Bugula neritina]
MQDSVDYDYVIVGAGPAGLQMAYFLQQAGQRYIVYESEDKAAKFFQQHPRCGRLISLNKKNNFFEEEEFNMRHDWNSLLSEDKEMKFTKYSDDLYPQAIHLHQYLNDYANRFHLNVKYNTKVEKISKANSTFTVRTEDREGRTTSCAATCVLMATGAVTENIPVEQIPGLELADTYSKHDMNKDLYKNKMILIIGGGNSAFETADYFSGSAGIVHVVFNKRIQFAWDTHYVGDLRAINNNIIDMYHLKSMHSTIGSQVVKIVKNEAGKLVVTFRDLNTHWDVPGWLYFDMEYDHVISCMGWNYVNTQVFDESIKVELVKGGRYPKLSNCWETDTENLFYIGSAMAAIDRQSASGFVHGFRYNIRTLFHILEHRLFKKPLPHLTLPRKDLTAISTKIIERSTISDSLYQMNGFLCDVMICDDRNATKYYTDLPIKHVMDRPEFKSAPHAFIIHLSYGFDKFGQTNKPVDNVHAPDFSSNHCASFLHPYIEYYSQGVYVDQTELQESLIVRYDDWSNAKFPQWTSSTNHNYIKHYVNDKLKWSSEVFNLVPLPEEVAKQIFIPLNKEEMTRLPILWENSECKPSQELLPKNPEPMRGRKLRPTVTEIIDSTEPQLERLKLVSQSPINHNLILEEEPGLVTTRQ